MPISGVAFRARTECNVHAEGKKPAGIADRALRKLLRCLSIRRKEKRRSNVQLARIPAFDAAPAANVTTE